MHCPSSWNNLFVASSHMERLIELIKCINGDKDDEEKYFKSEYFHLWLNRGKLSRTGTMMRCCDLLARSAFIKASCRHRHTPCLQWFQWSFVSAAGQHSCDGWHFRQCSRNNTRWSPSVFQKSYLFSRIQGQKNPGSSGEQGLYREVRGWDFRTWPMGWRTEKGASWGEDWKGTNPLA